MNAERSISTAPLPAARPAVASAAHAEPAQANAPLPDTTGPDLAAVPLPNEVAVLHAMIRELLEILQKTRHERDGTGEQRQE